MKFGKRKIACCALGTAVVLTSSFVWSKQAFKPHRLTSSQIVPATAEEIAAEREEEAEQRRIVGGGKHYKPLRMLVEFPGVEQPEMVHAGDSKLPSSTPVVGLEVDGEHYAFVLAGMRNPKHHIVNLVLEKKPISVTYCDLVDCVRVLTNDDKNTNAKSPIPLKVGGLDIDNQLVFELLGERYGQSSTGLPLSDFPFVRTTLGQWQDQHPMTSVYLGPASSRTDS